jgi:hypothetical protein
MTELFERERPAETHRGTPLPTAPEPPRPLPDALSPAAVLALQRSAGNAATGRLLRDGAAPAQQSLAVGGLPALRYNLPNIKIAEADVDTPAAAIHAELLIRGNITAVVGEQLPGVSYDQSGWRDEVTAKVNGIGSGLRISGLPDNPSIGATEGNQFNLIETRFTPPNTVSFIGQAKIEQPSVQTSVGKVRITGQPGCELRITITPKVQRQEQEQEVTDAVPSWWSQHASQVGTIALAVVVIGGLIAITVLTDGAAAPATGPAALEEAEILGAALAH